MIRILYVILLKFLVHSTFAQAPAIQWQKCLGGSALEGTAYGNCIQHTSDGGYIVAGGTGSNNGNVSGNHGMYDFWVVKLDNSGSIQWQKCLGGTLNDYAYSIQQTTDSGYIVAGSAVSNNGNVSGNHGNLDAWVVKLDNSGNLLWQKCFGGTVGDVVYSIRQTTDGGYVIAGYVDSNNGDVSGSHGGRDAWVVKLDNSGTIQWQKCLGGTLNEVANSIQQTTDGGYIIAGSATSNNGDLTNNYGNSDVWIVKLDNSATLQWQKSLGGSSGEGAYYVLQTIDGGYILTGFTNSSDVDVSGHHGSRDVWVVKLNNSGVLQWQKCLGGTNSDEAWSIQQTSDGGYIMSGSTYSNDGDVSGNQGNYDAWIIKLDNTGGFQWQKCIGGTLDDFSHGGIRQTNDGGYIVSGSTYSNDGDVTGNNGNSDFWVVKLGTLLLPITLSSFTAANKGNYNLIQWSTVSEDSGESFEVQYSTDAIHFNTITTVKGNGRPSDYQFIDNQNLEKENYYRLYMPQNAEGEKYSEIALVILEKGRSDKFNVFPNPAQTHLSFSEKLKTVEVFDTNGQLQLSAKDISNLQIQFLSKGTYIIKGITSNGNIVKTTIEKI